MPKWPHRIGWILGFLLSVIFPRQRAPLNLELDFALGGMISAMAGFSLMYSLLTDKTIGKRAERGMAIIAAIVGILAYQFYRKLLLDYPTPDTFIMWVEFVLFCVASFGLFAVLAFLYRNGGKFIVGKLGKLPLPER